MEVRGEVNRKLEEEKKKGIVKSGFECFLKFVVDVGKKEERV